MRRAYQLPVLAAVLVAGCSGPRSDIPALVVGDRTTELVVRAEGELVAEVRAPMPLAPDQVERLRALLRPGAQRPPKRDRRSQRPRR